MKFCSVKPSRKNQKNRKKFHSHPFKKKFQQNNRHGKLLFSTFHERHLKANTFQLIERLRPLFILSKKKSKTHISVLILRGEGRRLFFRPLFSTSALKDCKLGQMDRARLLEASKVTSGTWNERRTRWDWKIFQSESNAFSNRRQTCNNRVFHDFDSDKILEYRKSKHFWIKSHLEVLILDFPSFQKFTL